MPNQYNNRSNPQAPANPGAMAVVAPESKPGKLARVLEMPLEYVQLVKDVCAKGSTDEEFCLFLQIVADTGLNPLTKEIWFYKRWDGSAGKELPIIHASIQGRRKAAEKIGGYCPGRETEYRYDNEGNVISATAHVKRKIDGDWNEISFTADWTEFAVYKKDGKTLSNKWATMPKHMLAKCAETHALNRAFPTLERLADTESVSTESFAAAFGNEGEETPADPETERQRKIVIANLSIMAGVMLDQAKQDKLAGWMETASLQALADKFHTALRQYSEYARGVFNSIPEAEQSDALARFNVERFEDLGFEEIAPFIHTYEKKPEAPGSDFPTHTGE